MAWATSTKPCSGCGCPRNRDLTLAQVLARQPVCWTCYQRLYKRLKLSGSLGPPVGPGRGPTGVFQPRGNPPAVEDAQVTMARARALLNMQQERHV